MVFMLTQTVTDIHPVSLCGRVLYLPSAGAGVGVGVITGLIASIWAESSISCTPPKHNLS